MEKHIQQFRNILEPRKTESGIFKFMTRDWYPTKTFVLDRNYTPQDLKDITAKSLYIESLIEAESIRTGIRKEKLKQDVQQYLDEIGLEKKLYVIRWMGIVFLKLAFMMKIDIFVNETSISKLKSSLGKNPVLFLPTHRSYADFCLLTYLCYHYGIDFPAVAAGMDFYSMAVVGRSMRDTGAFYIRRTLAGAPLYAATLRHYVRTLVAKHSAPVEFFLEGTRSRSNKCLHPKYGMLSMTLLPLFSREVSDITIVPVNISYDKLIEHELFAYEHLGVPKPKESTGGLLRSIRRLNDNYGNIYINLGTPVSVKQFIKDSGNTDEILKPLDMQQVSPEQFKKVQDIADYVITLQQASTVVTVTNLLAIVVMESLMRNETLTLEEVGASVGLFGDLLRKLGANMFIEDVEASLRRVLVVHSRMLTIKDNRLRLLATPLMDVSPDITKKMKGHTLRADSMANAVPIIQLQMYVNPVLHYLVPAALLCATLQNGNSTIEQLRAPYSRVRALLRHEFFYIERNEQHTLDKAVEFCVENAVITNNGGYYTRGSNTSLQYTLSWTILPALATLSECIHVMREVSELPHKEALRRVQQRAELARLHPYCLSLEAAGNALHALLANGALNKLKSEDVVYQVVPQVMEECHLLVKSVLPAFSVDFDKSNSVILDQQVVSRL